MPDMKLSNIEFSVAIRMRKPFYTTHIFDILGLIVYPSG